MVPSALDLVIQVLTFVNDEQEVYIWDVSYHLFRYTVDIMFKEL